MTFMPIFVAALFVIETTTKTMKTTQMSIDDKWTNKMWSATRMEHYSAVERSRALVMLHRG